MKAGDLAGAIGKGLVAGAVGTAAMTVSSTVEAKLTKRDASTAPADAASKVLGIEPTDDRAKARFSNVVHWSYGTGWGAVRGLVGVFGLRPPLPAVAHFGIVWGSGLAMLPAVGVAPPVREWGARTLATDAWHHAVYATATSVAYRYLDRHTT